MCIRRRSIKHVVLFGGGLLVETLQTNEISKLLYIYKFGSGIHIDRCTRVTTKKLAYLKFYTLEIVEKNV